MIRADQQCDDIGSRTRGDQTSQAEIPIPVLGALNGKTRIMKSTRTNTIELPEIDAP